MTSGAVYFCVTLPSYSWILISSFAYFYKKLINPLYSLNPTSDHLLTWQDDRHNYFWCYTPLQLRMVIDNYQTCHIIHVVSASLLLLTNIHCHITNQSISFLPHNIFHIWEPQCIFKNINELICKFGVQNHQKHLVLPIYLWGPHQLRTA